MIVAIGSDIVQIQRLAISYEKYGNRLAEKILSHGEVAELAATKNKVAFLAKRFAAKEAAAKALGTGMRQGVHFKQIIVKHHADGAPYLVFVDAAAERASLLAVTTNHLTITDEKDYALAFVVLESV